MHDIDSILYLLGTILAVDGLTEKEVDFVKQNIFSKLEKAHLHVELEPHKIAIYMKHKVPDMLSDIHDIYKANSSKSTFIIPEIIKQNCIKNINNMKDQIKKEDLKNLITDTIKVDGKISPNEIVLRDFIFLEIDKAFI
jgi:hypothetical protein